MSTDRLAGRKTLAVTGFLEEFEKEAIKARVDIIELFDSFGIKLSSKGRGYAGNCPWHDDSKPSLSVDREKGLYHCFGCGESGDVVALVQKVKGLGFREALQFLSNRHDGPTNGRSAGGRRMPNPSAARPAIEPGSEWILDEVASRYTTALPAHPEARAYLASRGLDAPEPLSRFRLGYCVGDLCRSLSSDQKAELVRRGLLKASGAEHFRGCITVPLLDAADHVVGFYGRRITEGPGPAHLYLPGPHRGLVNRGAARAYPDGILLTESVLDALSLAVLGFENAIPCYGVHGFTEEHAALLRDERVKLAVVGFDADPAGRRGAEELRRKLVADGIAAASIEPPRGKDWNEYVTAGGSSEELRKLLAEAKPLAPTPRSRADHLLTAKREGDKRLIEIGGIRYRISGVRELFSSNLRVNVRAEVEGRRYIDNVDLYSARSRAVFASNLAALGGLDLSRVERDLEAILDHLESERDSRLAAADNEPLSMSDEDKALGMSFLRDPALVDRILEDLDTLGYVGEEENKLLVYLAATSRRMDDPISVLIVSESAAGKSLLIETVRRLMPPEEVIAATSLSDQALHYLPEDALLHKFLVMGEAVHSFAVEHQVREMLSGRELSRLVTLKDEKTGELGSRMVRKSVMVSCALSTTNAEVNPENASRFFVVGADESEAQTEAIFRRQREKYTLDRYEAGRPSGEAVIRRHHAAQRLLISRAIVNPFAAVLAFPSRLMRSRRDHERFLDLIAAVCFVRQYLKEEKEGRGVRFIECDIEDYRIAYRVMGRVMAATYGSIPQQALAVYEAVRILARGKAQLQGVRPEEVSIGQRELREASGMSAMRVKRAMRLLVDYEYLIPEGNRRRGSRLGYRLLHDEEAQKIDGAGIPRPEELEERIRDAQAGRTRAEWVTTGAAPLSTP
ncbi:MAG: toprim domain-containing protein [Acidobacteria bacterium]|nr:toprim domain-containing protein [Acidobacteriota bacterium]